MRNECVMIGCFNSGINTTDFPIPMEPEKSVRAGARTHAARRSTARHAVSDEPVTRTCASL